MSLDSKSREESSMEGISIYGGFLGKDWSGEKDIAPKIPNIEIRKDIYTTLVFYRSVIFTQTLLK